MRDFRRVPRKGGCLVLLAAVAPLLLGAGEPRKAPAGMRNAAAETAKAQMNRNFGKLPLSFEENRGQADRQVRFLSQGQGYSMFLTSSGVVLSLQTPSTPSQPGRHALIRMDFSGAKSAAVGGEEQQAAISSYFIGNDPAKWATGAANFGRVRYRELYPGIDLAFYGNQRQLEYDFVVAPGADPRSIRLAFEGVDGMRIDGAGDLVVSTAAGAMRQHKPIVYQEGGGQRHTIEGRYVLQADRRIAFEVGRYDARKPLIIDPVLSFATYLGSPGDELFGTSAAASTATYPAVALDSQGNVYVAGYSGGSAATFFKGHSSTELPAAQGGGGSDVFVVKLSPTGSLVYSVVFGGAFGDVAGGIAVDGGGNAYVTGYTNSFDFPITAGARQSTLPSGATNAFVTKVNAAGTALAYSTFLGGSGDFSGRAIAVDHSGNAYVTGTASASGGTPFPLVNPISSTPSSGFLAEVNAAGTEFTYSTYLSAGIGYGLAVDGNGDAYVTGSSGTATAPSPAQGYALKVYAGGTAVAYGPILLGSAGLQTAGFGIALDVQDDAYITGMTTDPEFPQITPSAAQTKYGGGLTDGFAVKLNPTGGTVYGTYIGGLGSNLLPERGSGIGVDPQGNAYVSGTTQCIGFPTVNAISGARNGGPAVLMEGAVSGSSSNWSPTTLTGSFDQVSALAFDPSGNLYAGTGALNAAGGGVYKLAGGTWTAASNGIASTTIDSIAVDPNTPSTVYAAGSGHLYQTTNGGASWTQLTQPVGTSAAIAIAKTSPSTVYVGSSIGLMYSTTAGSSWSNPGTPPGTGAVNTLIVDPINTKTAYAGTGTGVYQTVNGGAGWTPVITNLPTGPGGNVTSLAINGTTSTIYAATPNGLYYTTNANIGWTQAILGNVASTPMLVAVDGGNNVYVAFEGAGIATGTSGGTQQGEWSELTYNGLTQNQILALAVPPAGSGTAYAGIVSATTAFLTQISPNGQSFMSSTCIGGSDNNLGQNIAVTPGGAAYLSGATTATNFPATPGAVQTANDGLYDAFVARVDNVPFGDVAPADFFFNAINIMYELGITNGCQAVPLAFCPNDTNTRGEMAKFIVIAIEGGSNFTYNPTPYFSDVPSTYLFFSYIQKLYELGITNGCASSPSLMFCPDDGVTRDETAAFIIRSRFASIPFTYPTTPYFTDVPPSDPFFDYVQEMAQLGVTNGCTPVTYCPASILTRGEMAVFIVRGLLNQLLPATTPILTSVTPNSVAAGTPVTVTINGIGTHFAAGTSQVQTVAGITASNVVVQSPTLLTVQLIGVSGVTPNPSPIVVMTGTEQAGMPAGFTIE